MNHKSQDSGNSDTILAFEKTDILHKSLEMIDIGIEEAKVRAYQRDLLVANIFKIGPWFSF